MGEAVPTILEAEHTVIPEASSATEKLVALCQKGERPAQSEFYCKYRAEVARTVHKVLGPSADLEDVVQDVFVEVFRCIDRYKGEAKITTWLYRVCVNVALQRIRRQQRRPEGHAAPENDLPTHETPLRALERKESTLIVYEILDTLPPKKRMVFILHEIMGMDAKEISRVVKTNVLTVRTRLHYARKEFYAKALDTELFARRAS
jgi:RNA polymerase sigma-70 factor, ECF subfamily